jgi:oxygen-independent coproporphyrinogen-3 oxidase
MLGVYIHIPFCVRKCSYCGFFSTAYDVSGADNFLFALPQEAAQHARLLNDGRQKTIYIGGGTPTVLSCFQLSRLFDLVDELRKGPGTHEVTIEANPGTVTTEKLALLRERGVTRLSLGVQSFSDEVLAWLGRQHTAIDAVKSYLGARDAGFRNIGFDLMYGIPGQTEQQWHDTLSTAVSLRPEHLSVYSLSLDAGSRLSSAAAAGRITLPDDSVSADQYAAAMDMLGRSGYQQYEVSNFCIPGHACQHNSNYWQRGEYLGLGPGAWSFLGDRRSVTVADVDEYVSRLKSGASLVSFEEVLGPHDKAVELLFLGLRAIGGIEMDRYASLAGGDAAEALRSRLTELEGTGLFRTEGNRVMLTSRGMLLSNEALSRIIP